MQATQAEFELFIEWKRAREAAAHRSVQGPDPNHRGVIDSSYVRPGPSEFPKMAYRKSSKDPKGYATRVIESREEEASVQKQGWMTATRDVHSLLEGLERERSGASIVEAS